MKKIFLICILVTTSINIGYAKWGPLNMEQLKKYSSVIVEAELITEKSSEAVNSGKVQVVQFKPIKIIKGEIEMLFLVHGSQQDICKAQYYFKNAKGDMYLLFLNLVKGTDIYRVVNGPFGALPISEEKKVKWFGGDKKSYWKREAKLLSEVYKDLTR